MAKPKQITVEMTLSWTIEKHDWGDHKDMVEELVDNPRVILGNDLVFSLHTLNDFDYPELKSLKVTPV